MKMYRSFVKDQNTGQVYSPEGSPDKPSSYRNSIGHHAFQEVFDDRLKLVIQASFGYGIDKDSNVIKVNSAGVVQWSFVAESAGGYTLLPELLLRANDGYVVGFEYSPYYGVWSADGTYEHFVDVYNSIGNYGDIFGCHAQDGYVWLYQELWGDVSILKAAYDTTLEWQFYLSQNWEPKTGDRMCQMTVDNDGYPIISAYNYADDTVNCTVARFDTSGNVMDQYDFATGYMDSIVCMNNGDIICADESNAELWRIDSALSSATKINDVFEIGSYEKDVLKHDSNNDVIFAIVLGSAGFDAVARVETDGTLAWKIDCTDDYSSVKYIDPDGLGGVYVTRQGSGGDELGIIRIAPDGTRSDWQFTGSYTWTAATPT